MTAARRVLLGESTKAKSGIQKCGLRTSHEAGYANASVTPFGGLLARLKDWWWLFLFLEMEYTWACFFVFFLPDLSSFRSETRNRSRKRECYLGKASIGGGTHRQRISSLSRKDRCTWIRLCRCLARMLMMPAWNTMYEYNTVMCDGLEYCEVVIRRKIAT